jgi:hypothetical protein
MASVLRCLRKSYLYGLKTKYRNNVYVQACFSRHTNPVSAVNRDLRTRRLDVFEALKIETRGEWLACCIPPRCSNREARELVK